MNYVNCGNFKTSYEKDFALYQTTFSKVVLIIFLVLLFLFPFVATDYLLYIFNLIFVSVIGAVGLNILTGATGLISLGHGAFIGVGAYAAGYFYNTLHVNFIVAILFGGLAAAFIGSIFGIPSLRLKGLYLSIATLAAQFILEFLFVRMEGITGGVTGLSVDYAKIFGIEIDDDFKFYYLGLIFCILMTIFAVNIMRTRIGRAFLSIRDNYIAAEVMGVNIFQYKILSFAISSFYAGVAGGLWTFYTTIITPEHFTIGVSIQYLSMIIIGGLGKVLGSIFGAVFMTVLPEALKLISDFLSQYYQDITQLFASIREGVFGLVIILFLMFEPEGLYRRWKLIKAYWKLWPFSY
ncbi:branched-chain amino acid ABC transporter permease [Deferribacter autotrophicus]|uniref:Branched-chain amino acid ABC transporter permease n=1 Tax=Deferribacter autotrophicus TaxID=500465 RepID=A0A5A8F5N1_9BACT|nr:branched-chain amino acid ABC transporter permease [Deferribacter autotrophicus]KAA0259436.1 branched-chain amino acid ABC transporter permease [Deferribacter autotrophicus]